MIDLPLPLFPNPPCSFSSTELSIDCWLNFPPVLTRSLTAVCGALQTAVPIAQFILLVAKSFILSYLMKRSPLEKGIGCEAALIWVGNGRLPATSKVSPMIGGVGFAAKASSEGSFALSAVCGIVALVSVTLGQKHLHPPPWGFSLGVPGFFWP